MTRSGMSGRDRWSERQDNPIAQSSDAERAVALSVRAMARKFTRAPRALVWKDLTPPAAASGHTYEAKAAQGRYLIMPVTASPASGYFLQHWPEVRTVSHRTLNVGVETLEDAKAIAQADHDAGKDARP
jgi:hypothetical protein